MLDAEEPRVTVGVFQNVAWASRGIDALLGIGLSTDALSVMAPDSSDAAALIARVFGTPGATIDVASVGRAVVHGPLVLVLQGTADDLAHLGIAGTMRRAGFQAHDARIYELLTARGGVLVAIHSESR